MTITARPMAAARTRPRQPPVAQNHAANGTRNGITWGLVIRATARSAAASPFRPWTAQMTAASAEQHVDRLVLAPPGADVDDGRVQRDRGGPDDGPARPVAERECHEQRQPDVRDRGRGLHQRPDRRVRGVGHGLERRLDRGQEPPDVGHHRREREVLVVRVREAVDGDPVDPQDELVEVAAQALGREQDRADDDADRDGGDEPDDERRRPPNAGLLARHDGLGRHRIRRGRTPSTVRRSPPPRPARRSSDRRSGPRWPSPSCRRRGARAGSRRC